MKDLAVQMPAWILGGLGLLVSVLDLTGALKAMPWLDARLPALTLLLLAAVAGYLAYGRPRELRYLRGLTESAVDDVVQALDGVQVRRLKNSEEYYRYLRNRVSAAGECVDDLTWGLLSNSGATRAVIKEFDRYVTSLQAVCRDNESVKVREVFTFPSSARIHRAREVLESGCPNYFLAYYDVDHEKCPPLMQFIVIDQKEVVFGTHRGQLTLADEEFYLAVTHPIIVAKFLSYFNTIWQGAEKLQKDDAPLPEVLSDLERRLRPEEVEGHNPPSVH